MVKTFDESREETEDRTDRSPQIDNLEDIRDVLIPSIAKPFPDAVEERKNRREDRIIDLRSELSVMLQGLSGTDLSEADEILSELNDIDYTQLGQTESMRLMAQSNALIATQMRALIETFTSSLVFLDDIATAVEPAAGITVSGSNDTSDPGVPEPVIPQSDSNTIPTRNLFIRASDTNSENIYFGDDAVSPSDGFMLRPGESHSISLDFRDSVLYMASSEEGQEIQLMGVF